MLRDLIGSKNTEELIEEINVLYEKIIQIFKELRSWNEFFHSFKLPQLNIKNTEQRISTNCLHYFSNYAMICMILLCLQVVLSPMILLVLPCLLLISFYILIIHKKQISFGKIVITDSMKRTFCIILSLFLLTICKLLERMIWYIIYCNVICGLHMMTRPRSVTSKTNKVYQELKLNGFSWFSNDKTIFTNNSNSNNINIGGGGNKDMVDPENPTVLTNSMEASYIGITGYSSSIGNTDPNIMRKRGNYTAPNSYTSTSMNNTPMNNKND